MKKIALIVGAVLTLVSCTTDIQTIREERPDYLEKKVSIEGVVTMTLPIVNIYEIKDKTGQIYVQSTQELPNKDQKYTIEGIVREKKIEAAGISFMNELYVEELKRK